MNSPSGLAAAHLAMLRYKIAAFDYYIAQIAIEGDVMGLPECATLPETPHKKQSKCEARLRDERHAWPVATSSCSILS